MAECIISSTRMWYSVAPKKGASSHSFLNANVKHVACDWFVFTDSCNKYLLN